MCMCLVSWFEITEKARSPDIRTSSVDTLVLYQLMTITDVNIRKLQSAETIFISRRSASSSRPS